MFTPPLTPHPHAVTRSTSVILWTIETCPRRWVIRMDHKSLPRRGTREPISHGCSGLRGNPDSTTSEVGLPATGTTEPVEGREPARHDFGEDCG